MRRTPSDGFWLVVTLVALTLVVAVPAATWNRLETQVFHALQ